VADKDLQIDIREHLIHRSDFKEYAHDVTEAVLKSLERGHLDHLQLGRLSPPPLEPIQAGDLQFLKIAQIGHSTEIDRSMDLLNIENILGTFRGDSHSLAFVVSADEGEVSIYFGARKIDRQNYSDSTFDFVQSLGRSISGNLPGTTFKDYGKAAGSERITALPEEVEQKIRGPIQNFTHIAALTGIPSLRQERRDQFAQSLDRMIRALGNQKFVMLVIADPLPTDVVSSTLNRCFRLGSEMHAWTKTTISQARSKAESDTIANSKNTNRGGSEGTNEGTSRGESTSSQQVPILGSLLNAGIGLALAPFGGGVFAGSIAGVATNLIGQPVQPQTKSVNQSESSSKSLSKTWSESLGESISRGTSNSESASMSIEYVNKTAEHCVRILDGYIRRLVNAKSTGMWNVGTYFLADDGPTFNQGTAQLRALWSGKDSHIEPIRAIDLSGQDVRQSFRAVLTNFSNPVLSLTAKDTKEHLEHPLGSMYQALSTPLTTSELSLILNLPRQEVPGIRLQLVAEFGKNPRPVSRERESDLVLGRIVSAGVAQETPVGLRLEDLTRHMFVTGITGSGKTYTTQHIVAELNKKNVPFLVIEPAKGTYRNLLSHPEMKGLKVFTLGNESISPFRINPFRFVPGTNLITHIDGLKSIFTAAFPMQAAMPFIIEETLVKAFEAKGWDVSSSENAHIDMEEVIESWRKGQPDYRYTEYLPTLTMFMEQMDRVISSKGFGAEMTQNYSSTLKARLASLLVGSKGRMLNTVSGVTYEDLFDRPCVIELRSLGDEEEKALLMAILLSQQYQYREEMHRVHGEKRGLRHVTIIEEAHRLLRRPVGGEHGGAQAKAVESFANMLAEIREYGEGWIIVDQVPAKLLPDVVKNTSTKILHRVSARDDRETVGDSMGLTREQLEIVPRLNQGDAVFHTEGQDKAVWLRVDKAEYALRDVSNDEVRAAMAEVQKEISAHESTLTETKKAHTKDEIRNLLKPGTNLSNILHSEQK
jgi:Helicase HerA, central domain